MRFFFIYLLSLFFLTKDTTARDRFAITANPRGATHTCWERIILNPKLYDGKIVLIDGWIYSRPRVEATPQLYTDIDSLTFSRDFKSIRFEGEFYRGFLNKLNQTPAEFGLRTHRKFVRIFSRFKAYDPQNEEADIGEFVGPMRIIVLGADNEGGDIVEYHEEVWPEK
jgi:hypothetical protein